MARYEINHDGKIVQSETKLCQDKDAIILALFSQFGWEAQATHKDGPYQKITTFSCKYHLATITCISPKSADVNILNLNGNPDIGHFF